jgi:hypothetical protein
VRVTPARLFGRVCAFRAQFVSRGARGRPLLRAAGGTAALIAARRFCYSLVIGSAVLVDSGGDAGPVRWRGLR